MCNTRFMTGERSARFGSFDSPEARTLRLALVRGIAAASPWPVGGTWDPHVLRAIGDVPRHPFVPGAALSDAHADEPYPIGLGQTISQPTVVALMTQALLLRGPERVLEIGTGCGYQTAVLAQLARAVFSVERIAALGEAARARLAAMGIDNVMVRIDDGYHGWPEAAPFDRIVVTAAPAGVPRALIEQLADGGILVAPVGDMKHQELVRWTRHGQELESEELGSVRFVPMLPRVS